MSCFSYPIVFGLESKFLLNENFYTNVESNLNDISTDNNI
jgi:hypothetical protein